MQSKTKFQIDNQNMLADINSSIRQFQDDKSQRPSTESKKTESDKLPNFSFAIY